LRNPYRSASERQKTIDSKILYNVKYSQVVRRFVMKQLLLLAALPGALLAQALEGTWQGALTPNPNLEIRMVFRTKDDSAHQGMLYNLAAGRQFNLGAIALQGSSYRYRGDRRGVEAVGELSSDTVGWRALGDKVQS
jgi:hypothetical protein